MCCSIKRNWSLFCLHGSDWSKCKWAVQTISKPLSYLPSLRGSHSRGYFREYSLLSVGSRDLNLPTTTLPPHFILEVVRSGGERTSSIMLAPVTFFNAVSSVYLSVALLTDKSPRHVGMGASPSPCANPNHCTNDDSAAMPCTTSQYYSWSQLSSADNSPKLSNNPDNCHCQLVTFLPELDNGYIYHGSPLIPLTATASKTKKSCSITPAHDNTCQIYCRSTPCRFPRLPVMFGMTPHITQ